LSHSGPTGPPKIPSDGQHGSGNIDNDSNDDGVSMFIVRDINHSATELQTSSERMLRESQI